MHVCTTSALKKIHLAQCVLKVSKYFLYFVYTLAHYNFCITVYEAVVVLAAGSVFPKHLKTEHSVPKSWDQLNLIRLA
jgi:hypothetical protein